MVVSSTTRRPRKRKAQDEPVRIALEVNGDWMEADTLRAQMLAAAASCSKVELNFHGREGLSPTVFQVLLAWSSSKPAGSGGMSFTGVGEGLSAAFTQAGAGEFLRRHANCEER